MDDDRPPMLMAPVNSIRRGAQAKPLKSALTGGRSGKRSLKSVATQVKTVVNFRRVSMAASRSSAQLPGATSHGLAPGEGPAAAFTQSTATAPPGTHFASFPSQKWDEHLHAPGSAESEPLLSNGLSYAAPPPVAGTHGILDGGKDSVAESAPVPSRESARRRVKFDAAYVSDDEEGDGQGQDDTAPPVAMGSPDQAAVEPAVASPSSRSDCSDDHGAAQIHSTEGWAWERQRPAPPPPPATKSQGEGGLAAGLRGLQRLRTTSRGHQAGPLVEGFNGSTEGLQGAAVPMTADNSFGGGPVEGHHPSHHPARHSLPAEAPPSSCSA